MAALRAVKLRALVRSITGADPLETAVGDSDPAVVVDGRAYRLVDDIRGLGPAVHWAMAQGATAVTVLAEPAVAADLARRALLLSFDVDVRSVVGAEAKPVEPAPPPTVPDLPDEMWRAAAAIVDAGARVVDDHGRLVAEVAGLEVARIDDPLAMVGLEADLNNLDPAERYRVAVGVGEADRELQQYVNRHADQSEVLQAAVETVSAARADPAHPLSRLARPRWLRSLALDDPDVLGLTELEAVAPLRSNPGVFDREPAAAHSTVDRTTVVFSTGVDLDLVPEAADIHNRIDPDSRLLVVVPQRDLALVTRHVAMLAPEAEVVSMSAPWESDRPQP